MTIVAGSLATAADVNAAVNAKANAANPTFTGTMTLAGTTATGFGQAVGQAPVFTSRAGLPSIEHSRFIINRVSAVNTGGADVLIRRDGTGLTGTGGLNSSLNVTQSVASGDGSGNWATVSQINSQGSGNTVGHYAQAYKTGSGTGMIWALVSESADQTGSPSSVSGTITSQEMDVGASDVDDGANLTRFGGVGLRSMVHGVFSNQSAAKATVTEFGVGMWFGTDTNVYVDSLYAVQPSTQVRNYIDTRGAITPAGSSNPVSAVTMTHGHVIDFNGGAAVTSAPGNYWWYDTATSKMKYNVGATTVLSIDNSGNVRALGTITASVTP